MRPLRALAVLALLVPAAAHAADKRAAAQHFRSGSALYERGEYVQALEEFDAGLSAFPLPAFHVNIGQCYRKLERFDDAALEFTRFLDSGAGDPKLREEVAEALSEVRGESSRRREEAEHKSLLASSDSWRAAEPIRAAEPSRAAEPTSASASAPDDAPSALFAVTPPPKSTAKKSRWWVWTIVGVAVAGAVAAGVAVGVVESQPSGPRAGTLGLLDGRR